MQTTSSFVLPPHIHLLSVIFCKLILSEEELRLPHLQIAHTQVAAPSACHSTIPEKGMHSCISQVLLVSSQSQVITNIDVILKCIMCDLWNNFVGCEPNLKEQLLKYIFLSIKNGNLVLDVEN